MRNKNLARLIPEELNVTNENLGQLIRLDYTVRWGALILAALVIGIGAVMVFVGLEGSFDLALQAPHTIEAKLTNASPGIVFATAGIILAALVILRPVPKLSISKTR